ncbi:receptor activity-modifying protein 3-like [Clupea harengus]|uniref:Receptor activity-modifying protein 3 n=1 Tax=Clupea harengus TaxID=7950 RepID=A0A6P3VRA1_CLUHA|nr:receptor activity-modifying protein 3-like [Clupea harengus]
MDRNALTGFKVFVMGILVNTLMTSALSETESLELGFTRRPLLLCNETRLLLEMEVCGDDFKRQMARVDSQHWCNLTHFISEYHLFSACTEKNSERIGCFWPNPLVEGFIIHIHKHYFSNCTLERVVWVDPSDDLLAVLILIPILLTLAMIALVVWCSKRSDILA